MGLSPRMSPRMSGYMAGSMSGSTVAVDDFIPPKRSGLVEAWDVRAGVTTATGGVSGFEGRIRGDTLLQGTEAKRPGFTADTGFFNDLPVIQCNGTTDWLGVTGLSALAATSTKPYVISVMRYRSDASGFNMGFALKGAGMDIWHLHQLDAGPVLYNRAWWPPGATAQSTSFTTGVVEIVESFLDAGGVLRLYIDGTLVASTGTGLLSAGPLTSVYIGTNDGASNLAAVSFAASAVYSAVPSDADRAANRTYYREIFAGSGV